MATVHLISGLIGSGKTTLARQLERELPAVRISLDEWIMSFFGGEAPEPMRFEWWMEHAERCSRFSWSLCRQVLATGTDVVLDCGFLVRAHRDEFRALARAAGADTLLHYVRAATDVRRERINARNRDRGETYALTVTESMFDSLAWEPPDAEELVQGRIVDT